MDRCRAVTRLAMAGAAAGAAVTMGVVTAPEPAHADWVRDGQWQLRELHAEEAWRYATGAGITVAVLDSGVDATHPDLAGRVLPGTDLVDGSTDGRVDHVGHGTTVAGLIAARADDADGVSGLAPDARILPVRVLDDANRYGDASVIANGVRWAVDHGASVVNLSLGGAVRSERLAQALGYAAAHNVVVVACTGNRPAGTAPGSGQPSPAGPTDRSPQSPAGLTDQSTPAQGTAAERPAGTPTDQSTDVWYPAREPGVVAVAGLAGTDPEGTGGGTPDVSDDGSTGGASGGGETLWTGSITGPQTALTAPAANLLGARPGGYWRVQGTSFAAPLVAAAATLVRSRWPGLDAANVINRLIHTAHDLGRPGRDDRYGFGEVDPAAALTAPVPTVAANPLAATAVRTTDRSAVVQPAAATAGEPARGHADRGTAAAVHRVATVALVATAVVVAMGLLRGLARALGALTAPGTRRPRTRHQAGHRIQHQAGHRIQHQAGHHIQQAGHRSIQQAGQPARYQIRQRAGQRQGAPEVSGLTRTAGY